MAEYPLDHARGYSAIPCDLQNLEPLIRHRVCPGLLLILFCRVRRKPGWVQGSHGPVYLQRGQCIAGIRELAALLGVGRDTVVRAVKQLETLGLITRDAGQLGSVFTLVNYGEFGQIGDDESDTPKDTPPDSPRTAPGHPPYPNEREKGEREERGTGKHSFDFESVYKSYPRKQGKAKGMAAARRKIRASGDFERLRHVVVDVMAPAWHGHDTKYCPLWSTFITGERWRDEQPPLPLTTTEAHGGFMVTGDTQYDPPGEVKL